MRHNKLIISTQYILFFFILTFAMVLFINTTEIEATTSQIWKPLPLRTQAQKGLGLAGGEGMQMIWGLSYAPSNPNVLYLVSDTSQVWKSEDGGNSWQMKHKGFLANGGISLSVDPNNENIVFVAGSLHNGGQSNNVADGIYRTKDGGESWELVRQTPFFRLEVKKGGVNFAFAGSNTIYAGTHEEGLLKSTNGGDAGTWNKLNILTDTKILDVKVHPQNPSIIFLASEIGLYKFTDDVTQTLELIGTGLPNLTLYPECFLRAIAINPNNPNIIYVTVGPCGVYKSDTAGNTFNDFNGLPPNILPGNTATYLAMSPVNPDYLYVSFYELGENHPYYTHDGGVSWHQPSVMDSGGLVHDIGDTAGGVWYSTPIAPSPIDQNIAIASAAGDHLEKTVDGGDTWIYSGNGYTGGKAGVGSTSFSWDPNDPDRFALFLIDYGPMLTTDGGSTFKSLNIPFYEGGKTTPVGALDPTPNSKVIVTAVGGWSNQVIAITRDEGQNWTLINGTDDNYKFVAFHPQNPDIIYVGQYKSTDKGVTWTPPLTKKIAAMFKGNGNIVYAVDVDTVNHKTTVSKSTDGGVNWTPYGIINSQIVGKELAIDPQDPDRIYLTAWEGIYIWNKDQSRWDLKTDANGLERDMFGTLNSYNITVDANNRNIVYTGKYVPFYGQANGIFRSLNQGEAWNNITFNLGHYDVNPLFTPWSISVNPHNSQVYIGSSHGTFALCTDNDGDGYFTEGGACGPLDCNDSSALEHPDQRWYNDADNDGYSEGTTQTQCIRPSGYKAASELTAISGDCDDSDPKEHPGQTWYKDTDGDSYSSGEINTTSCTRPAGYKAASELTDISGDCNDDDSAINPATLWHPDYDGDSYGNPTVSLQQCTQPTGYILNNTDCDDSDAYIYPGGPPVRVEGSTINYYSALQDAYNASVDGETIQSLEVTLTESPDLNLDKSVLIQGGYDCSYTTQTGKTTVNGNMSISDGIVTVENFILQ